MPLVYAYVRLSVDIKPLDAGLLELHGETKEPATRAHASRFSRVLNGLLAEQYLKMIIEHEPLNVQMAVRADNSQQIVSASDRRSEFNPGTVFEPA